jgi:hypothetical protein
VSTTKWLCTYTEGDLKNERCYGKEIISSGFLLKNQNLGEGVKRNMTKYTISYPLIR